MNDSIVNGLALDDFPFNRNIAYAQWGFLRACSRN
jgi:hypothetical protein